MAKSAEEKAAAKQAAADKKAAKAALSVEKGTAKYNSAGKKRTTADLNAMGEKGKVLRIIRGAVSLTNREMANKAESKKLAGRVNSAMKKGGKIDVLDETGPVYAGLKDAAKDALADLKSNTYGASTKALIKYIEDNMTGAGGGGGRKGFSPAAYLDIEL